MNDKDNEQEHSERAVLARTAINALMLITYPYRFSKLRQICAI
jgi:hypothetical protein